MRPLDKLRPKTIVLARGRTLELGVGTGLNFAFYGPEVTHLTGLEPDPANLSLARERAAALSCEWELVQGDAQSIPLPDATFDTVVATWTLCSIGDPARALREVRRVLVPGGQLVYLEHGRSPHRAMRLAQRLADPCWQRVSRGCHLMREPHRLVADAGLAPERIITVSASPWSPFPMFAGLARRPPAQGAA